LYFEKTGDAQAREHAFRSLNYATYFAASDGKISCCGDNGNGDLGYWFEDGYGDAGRSFIWAMGAVPEFAPMGQNHLLRSTSVVQNVAYGRDTIQYRTFDKAGTEVLRVTFKPRSVVAGEQRLTQRTSTIDEGYMTRPLPGGDYEIRIRHAQSNQIRLQR
jgi:hypothetical protein